tara:strand:- start:11087 stop:12571 length:1485 start_codon:yes stop_codon:yes gene_type:complete
MAIFNNIIAGASGQSVEAYEIDQSARFNSGDSAYLSRTVTTSATWTLSVWVKRGNLSAAMGVLEGGLHFNSGDTITAVGLTTSAVFRDVSSWYHIVVSNSGLYVNGSRLGDVSTGALTNPDIGRNSSSYFDGYLAELNFIDGTSLAAATFGETDTNGQWVPKEYSGSYGAKGFYLKFQDSSAFGDDSSGNTNDWTSNNLVATDQVLDSPTNNFPVMNPLLGSTIDRFSLLEGNLKITANGSDWNAGFATFGVPLSGKWYWENVITGNNNGYGGVVDRAEDLTVTNPTGGFIYVFWDGRKRVDGTFSSYGATVSAGDIISYAINMDTSPRQITFYKNNSTQGTLDITGSCATEDIFPYITSLTTNHFNFGQDSSFAGIKTAQNNADGNGIGDFYYSPPSGFLSICASNMPEVSAETVSYVGNGSTDGTFVYLGYLPSSFTISSTTYSLSATNPSSDVDWLANGLKIRSTTRNGNGTSYSITAAPIEQDFKYSNAR